MVVIGLTGNIGAGKSRVLAYLQQKGALALDADRLAHEAMAPGMPANSAIVAEFGPSVRTPAGEVDRAALGAIVFADPQRLADLEAILHPEVFRLAIQRMDASDAQVVVIEAIKLLEARRLLKLCDEVWVVTASQATLLRRLMENRGMSVDEARRRLANQTPQATMIGQATQVIANDDGVEALHAELDRAWVELVAKYGLAAAGVEGQTGGR
jgi:dephospho-CoA kinase